MRVLITGGAGYIGNELVDRLAADTEFVNEIVIYDNLAKGNYNLFTGWRKLPAGNIRFVRGDILDGRKLRRVMDGMDVVYHLAAKVTTPFADHNAQGFEQINHWGTAEVVYAAEDTTPGKVVHLSSTSAYGSGRKVASADEPLTPRSFYGISKRRGEEHMMRLMDKLQVVILRCGNVYGSSRNLRVDAAINRLTFDAHFTNRITIHGSGEQHRAFISMARASDALCQLLRSPVGPGVYNLVDKNLTINQVAGTLSEIYDGLDTIYVDQHLPMHDIQVAPDLRINACLSVPEQSLLADLQDFRQMFRF